jgi:hypothetical protein
VRVGPEHVDAKAKLFEERIDVWDALAQFGLIVRGCLEIELHVSHFFV